MTRVLLFAFVFLVPSTAVAYCLQPNAPSFQYFGATPQPPRVPVCVNQYTNTHTCDDWTIQTYNAEVDRFNAEIGRYMDAVRRYADAVDSYYSDAVDHVDCLIRQVE
jgi:hypothetical protein